MAVNYRHGLSILELIVYLPTLFMALWMAFRHGFQRNSGWIFLVIFSLARIVGSCCYLATINDPSSIDLYLAWAVCMSIGLSPLTLTCVGLLSRANDSIRRKTSRGIHPLLFKIVGLLTLVGLILCIVGQVQSMGSLPASMPISTKTKVGYVLFIVAWTGLSVLLVVLACKRQSIEDGEHRLLLAVGLTVPLLLVRLIYSLLGAFGHSTTFSMMSGNVTVELVMSVLEEIFIVLICLGVGVTLEVRPRVTGYEACEAAQADRALECSQSPEEGPYRPENKERIRKKRRGGPITQLVGLALDEINYRRK
ncbi:hypothetical protein BO70DRAFT_289418 [Aspergillus heteromorphus CBS 117.55]|uniref:DUF7702 domain-containing protein n=1 Tax=Aspergillus heteromorphus CBS 117.55 TaxID=1448321 RepID=A0A317WJY1_9EURO|nr:uncharacterized protein BO70DRAFT_289418 [Aspergillus heteromorphus CBS 117.55]PWY85981.1 hypothetical protein BO70DRAFT_289418 [Aspergillus heteromorphus CBS 117.55]